MQWRRLILTSLAVVTLASSVTSAERLFRWEKGQLKQLSSVSIAADQVAKLINARKFKSALNTLKSVKISPQESGELSLAIAGHLDNDQPQAALDYARQHLAQLASGKDKRLLRLKNELRVYLTLHAVKLPWATRSPGHAWVPSPDLLPARDVVRRGDLRAGRQRVSRGFSVAHLLMSWQLAAFFERDSKFSKQYQTLLNDLGKSLQEAKARGNAKMKLAATSLLPLYEQARKESWASLSVPPDSLLYGRAMLEPMRAYYWWFRQMGAAQRPMSKQGFDEIIGQLRIRFPGSPIIRVYSGQRVTWGDQLRPADIPKNAPKWAANQVELRARVDHVVHWWFKVRQQPDGQLGGGWEDDCEALRRFSLPAMIWGDKVVARGIRRLVDGIWDNSGQIERGFDRQMKDVEHASEMAADSSVILAIDYGDPHQVERFMQTCKTIDELHFGTNKSGRRQFKGMVLNSKGVNPDPKVAFDVLYSGRAMRPVAMLAWYSHNPRAVKLLTDWARTWNYAALQSRDSKPAGVFPAAIRFGSESVGGRGGSWWDPGLGGLYRWNPQDIDMVLGKVLQAYQLTRDATLLQGVEAQLKLQREFLARSIENPATGSREWAGMQLRNHLWMASWYQTATGRKTFNDLLAASGGYPRFSIARDFSAIAELHAGELNAMRVNLPMITTEVRGTDRINLYPFSLTGPISGSHIPVTQSPNFVVTWRNIGRDCAVLVGPSTPTETQIWLYSFNEKGARPQAQFWRLAAGRYQCRLFADENLDGKPDGKPLTTFEMDRRSRRSTVSFVLPGRKACLLHVVRKQAYTPVPFRQPDAAVSHRDLLVRTGKSSLRGKLVVHSIGSQPLSNIKVRIELLRANGQVAATQTKRIARMEYPYDLNPRRKTVGFRFSRVAAGSYRLRASLISDRPEITTNNNRTELKVTVK